MKHAFGKWNPHLKHKKTIDKRVYEHLVQQFQTDIHNGRVLYQYELSRYHILAINLVAPIDHYFQHTRGKKRRHVPMGTFDHLYVAMGIHLAHIHGPENVVLLTADNRVANIVGRCRGGISPNTVRRLKLKIAEEVTGILQPGPLPPAPEPRDRDADGVEGGLRGVAVAVIGKANAYRYEKQGRPRSASAAGSSAARR